MTFRRQGFTLVEIIVVLMIIGICAAVALPNFTAPTEQAKAATAKNNLLAIYSAEQNYFNNNPPTGGSSANGYYGSPPLGGHSQNNYPSNYNDIAGINSMLGLNIQDDGSYIYYCQTSLTVQFECFAFRNESMDGRHYVLQLLVDNTSVQLGGSAAAPNPVCTAVPNTYSNWCP